MSSRAGKKMSGKDGRDGSIRKLLSRQVTKRLIKEFSLAVTVYGMITWIYVAVCALVAPSSLALPLTHLLPHLREDTSGVLGFGLSFVGFVTYRLSQRSD